MTPRRMLGGVLALAVVLGGGGCAARPEQAADLVVWHWMTDREEALQTLAARYQELTGVRVQFELYAPSDVYTQKIQAAAQTATLPDIYGVLGESRDFAGFVKGGHVRDLTASMLQQDGAWRHRFFERALAMSTFEPGNAYGVPSGIYGVPLDMMNIQLLYNKRLFRQAGLDPDRPPETWEELLALGDRLEAAGIQGLVSGWGEIWLIDCFASNYAWNVMGRDKVIATIQGRVQYTDPDWIRVFRLFAELREAGLLAQGVVTMVNKVAEQTFAMERAALAFNGSWCVNVYRGMNPNLEYGVLLPPRVSEAHPMMIWGGAGTSLVVNARSRHGGEAEQFLRWMTDKDQQVFLASTTLNLPATRQAVEEIPEVLAAFADDMDRSFHPSVLPVSEYPAVLEAFDKGIQSIITGELTPEEVGRQVQAAKERELKRESRRVAP